MKKILSIFSALAVMVSLSASAFSEAADTEVPSDVENVVATACNAGALLTWDASTDNVKVTGYKVYSGTSSVSKEGDKYTFDPVDVGDVLKSKIDGLENGTKYYFAVTAYDAAGNESASYSYEVNITPKADAVCDTGDVEAPTVVKAEAVSKTEVEVEFSEKVKLPEENPEQAFKVENDETLELLDVTDAVVMEDKDVDEGKEGKMVKLTTAEQEKDAAYVLTATIDVTDLAGNPIISGTSDTAPFTGTDKAAVNADTVGPSVDGVEVIDTTHLLVNFDESVVLGLETDKNFEVVMKGLETTKLIVSEVQLGNNTAKGLEDASVILTVAEMTAGKKYIVKVTGVTDEAMNPMSADGATAEFTAPGEDVGGEGEGEEVTTLADATNLTAKGVQETVSEATETAEAVKAWKVVLSWVLPKDSAATLQKLYYSKDGNTYTETSAFGPTDAGYEFKDGSLKTGGEYWFKLTQGDNEGTESKGVIAKVKLAETGPGVIGLIVASFIAGKVVTRKKK
jgi:hypothetical protein